MANTKKIFTRTVTVERFFGPAISAAPALMYCNGCQRNTEMLTLDEAVTFSGQAAGALIHWIQTETLHSSHTAAGHIRICRKSLTDQIEN